MIKRIKSFIQFIDPTIHWHFKEFTIGYTRFYYDGTNHGLSFGFFSILWENAPYVKSSAPNIDWIFPKK